MKDFVYHRATTLDQAVGWLAEHGPIAKVLCGGTDLIVQLREGQRQADVVVDIKHIPELMSLAWEADGRLRLGAGVPCYQVYDEAAVVRAYPALADAARIIGGWQIQSRASIGGNLCNSSPAADSIPTLIAYDAICQLAGPSGGRDVPVADFCTSPGRNVLERGELLAAIVLPLPAPHASAAYQRFIPRNEMDIAVVGACAWLRLDASGATIEQARLALAAVAPTPLPVGNASQWLAGKLATSETFAEAGRLAAEAIQPISDKRGTAGYRRHLTAVLVRRTLAIAADRARGVERANGALAHHHP